MDTKSIIEYWFRGAEEDYTTAQLLFSGERYAHALFFCHLTIEKTLKALVVKTTSTHAPFEHNLLKLAELAELNLFQENLDVLDEINTFNIKGRYDDYRREFDKKATKDYAKKYFNETTNLYLWLKEQHTK